MRTVDVALVKAAVKKLAAETAFHLPPAVIESFSNAIPQEESPRGRAALELLLHNAEVARDERLALCQDCGLAIVFIDLGQEVMLTGGSLREAVDAAVAEAYKENYLRSSTCHPFTRKNTGTNTPALLHVDIVPGDGVRIRFAAKGGGAENMSRLAMLKPSQGKQGVLDEIVRTADLAGPNPCPPIIVGVGIGGNFDYAALLAKKAAVFRDPGTRNEDPELDEMEQTALRRINALGIGPQGFGGRVTALGVHIILHTCHIASFPVAINIQCVAARHGEVEL